MRVLVTGANGFIGRHLLAALKAQGMTALPITRQHSAADLQAAATSADFAVHLAGINRPQPGESYDDNARIAQELAAALAQAPKPVPVIYASSTQAERDNEYGISKKTAEDALLEYARARGTATYIYRLPNVFGPGARPDYNSAVATFCHRIARGEPIAIHDPAASVTLVYVDDVIASFLNTMRGETPAGFVPVAPTYPTTVGELAAQIQSLHNGAHERAVAPGLHAALETTYRSAQPGVSHAKHA